MKKLLFICFFLPQIIISQHNIKGTFSPVEEFTYAFIYKNSPTGADYIDRAKLKSDGSFIFKTDDEITPGIYKIVYATPPEENNFNFFYDGKEDVIFTFDLEMGLTFISSNDNLLWDSYLSDISNINGQISQFYTSENTDKKTIESIFKNLAETQSSYEKAATNSQVINFIKSNRTYIPQSYEDINTYSKNLKANYFEHIAFNNPLIQSSDFLSDRVLAYIYATPPTTESYKQAIDDIVNAIGNDSILKMNLLEPIWSYMLETENDAVANYISDSYLLELAVHNKNELLIEVLEDYKNTAIGHKAVDFEFTYLQDNKPVNTTLYQLDTSESYLLIFWSSTCSHCLEKLPKVKALMDKYPNTTVIAYGLESGVRNWKKTITQFPDFLNTYDLANWDSLTVKSYAVQATPSFFVLDKNKTIIAKPNDVDELETYLGN
jgi:thiol-disulfide isomerase/thioredoxin